MIDVESRDGTLEVTRVGEAMGAERAKVGKVKVRAEDLEDIYAWSRSRIRGLNRIHSQPRDGPSGNPTCEQISK